MTEDEEREICLNCPKPECDNCFGKKVPRRAPWMKWQENIVRLNPDDKVDELMEKTGLKRFQVQTIRKNYGIGAGTKRKWTEEEHRIVMEKTTAEAAEIIGVNHNVIRSRRYFLKQKGW